MVNSIVGTPYTRFRASAPYDAIVIGSGIGGLGTAATLAKAAGQRVLVLERHYTAGGLTHVFHRPGFEWDVGVHYVGQAHKTDSPTAALFNYLTEGRLSWHPMPDVYDRVDINGLRFDYVSGKDRLRDALVGAFPREQRAVDRYFKAIGHCVRSLPLFYAEKALPSLIARHLGGCLRAPFLRSSRYTTGKTLDDCGASRELKAVLTAQWGDYGLPPGQSSFGMHAIIAAHYLDGAAYPVGGASQIARSLLPTIERAGGAVVVDADVDRILVSNGSALGVRMKDGAEFRATTIVSDVGLGTTLGQLLSESSDAVHALVDRVERIGPSLAHLCLYVGVSTARLARPLNAANLWLHPSLDFDRNWSTFAADLDAPFPLLFVSFPSAKDPTFERRYPGHQTIEVVVPAPYDLFMKWRGSQWKGRGPEYVALKERLQERMLVALCQHVPEVAGAVDTCELSTPLSTQHFVNAAHGETYGLAHNPARFASRDLRPATPIRNLFLTGQDISTCGVTGALAGAIASASAVLHRNLFRVVGAAEPAGVKRDRIGEAA
jgi:all-trans-retinol 13,14-reductase